MQVEQFILSHEPIIRLAFFGVIFVVLTAWELAAPNHPLTVTKAVRWRNNLALVVLNTFLLRLLFPITSVGIAAWCASQHWGLLNVLNAPFWLALPVTFVALDFAIWAQHVLVHAVPVLWRVHRVHHADLDFDIPPGRVFIP